MKYILLVILLIGSFSLSFANQPNLTSQAPSCMSSLPSQNQIEDSREFMRVGNRILDQFEPHYRLIFALNLNPINIEINSIQEMKSLFNAYKIHFTDLPLFLTNDPEEKSAINYPELSVICVNSTKWKQLEFEERGPFVLHEMLPKYLKRGEPNIEITSQIYSDLRKEQRKMLPILTNYTTTAEITEVESENSVARKATLYSMNYWSFFESLSKNNYRNYKKGEMTLSIHNLPDVPIIVDPKTGAYMNGKGPRIEFIISSNNNSLISQKCLRFDFNKGDSQFILKSIKNKSRIGPFNASINSQDRRVALDCFGTSQNDLQCSIFIGSSKAQFAQCSD